jgi:2-aminoadipate transaminase
MATSNPFSYDGLYSQVSTPVIRGENRHAKYDFAVAYPDPDTLPLEGLADSLRAALEREGRDLALYPVSYGLPSLREWVAEKLARDRNMKVGVDDIVLTSGSGEAISMIIAALTDPGDVLLTEEYVYLGTLRAMRRFGADVRSVKCDDQGLIPEELDNTLAAVAAEGKTVKFLYTIPVFQNPLGWTMSLERRIKTLEITQKYGVPVLEDDCYVDLRFEGEDVTSMHSLDDTGRVLYVGSFSKIVAPGVRLGYMVAPQEVIQRAMSFKGGGGVNQFAALAVQEYARGSMDAHIEEQNQSLRVKRDAMLSALGENFGDAAQWSKPEGGLYVWLEMPEDVNLAAIQDQVFDEGVGYYNGAMFSPEGRGTNCARLCFGHPTAETVAEGVAELARIFEGRGILGG